MPDLPDYYTAALVSWSEIAGLKGGLDASKEAAPAVKDVYLATDTSIIYACYTAGVWTDITHACLLLAGGTMAGDIAMGGYKVRDLPLCTQPNDAVRKAYADLFTLLSTFNNHKARHQNGGDDEIGVAGLSGLLADDQHVIDAEAKAAAVQAGAITNGVTLAPTHDAVYDVKQTADAALPAGDKYTDADAVDAMGAKADGNPLHHDRAAEWGATEHTAIGDGAPHHTKYTGAEAVTAVKAGVKLNELQAPDGAVACGGQILDNIGVPSNAGDALRKGTALTITEMPANVKLATITFIIDGGGAAITTGIKGDLEIPFGCTINRVTMLADQSGSISVDIWKQAFADYPPEDANSITAAQPCAIVADTDSQNSSLIGWTTAITAGDCLRFNVDSITDIERVTISLKVTKT